MIQHSLQNQFGFFFIVLIFIEHVAKYPIDLCLHAGLKIVYRIAVHFLKGFCTEHLQQRCDRFVRKFQDKALIGRIVHEGGPVVDILGRHAHAAAVQEADHVRHDEFAVSAHSVADAVIIAIDLQMFHLIVRGFALAVNMKVVSGL